MTTTNYPATNPQSNHATACTCFVSTVNCIVKHIAIILCNSPNNIRCWLVVTIRPQEMADEDFLALGTDYRHTGKNYKSVQAIHQLAEEQVTRYMADELARQAETTNLPVLAFAVTQVANRCHVTQVGW